MLFEARDAKRRVLYINIDSEFNYEVEA